MYVIEHSIPIHAAEDAGPQGAVLFLGVDWHGVPLEVGAIELGDDEWLVIHAMPLRRTYLAEFEQVMRWHER